MIHSVLPITLFYQSLTLFLAWVLLPFIGLVEDLLGCRPPLEAVASEFLEGWFSDSIISRLNYAWSRLTELWEKKEYLILTAFVCHATARPLWCLAEFCKNIENILVYMFWYTYTFAITKYLVHL